MSKPATKTQPLLCRMPNWSAYLSVFTSNRWRMWRWNFKADKVDTFISFIYAAFNFYMLLNTARKHNSGTLHQAFAVSCILMAEMLCSQQLCVSRPYSEHAAWRCLLYSTRSHPAEVTLVQRMSTPPPELPARPASHRPPQACLQEGTSANRLPQGLRSSSGELGKLKDASIRGEP